MLVYTKWEKVTELSPILYIVQQTAICLSIQSFDITYQDDTQSTEADALPLR